jgi:hypothetical protein
MAGKQRGRPSKNQRPAPLAYQSLAEFGPDSKPQMARLEFVLDPKIHRDEV